MEAIPIRLNALPFAKILKEQTCYLKFRTTTLSTLAGFFILLLIPFLHFGVISHLWDNFIFRVDKTECTCSCWDTIFKGRYEKGPAGYKHVYFNATSNTFFMWTATIIAVLLLYEYTKRITLLYLIRDLRKSMAVLFFLSIYPHYYAWWGFFNYLNDEFYGQWYHQLYFTFTELLATLVIVDLLNKNTPVTTRKLLVIGCVSVLHIILASYDQFVYNILLGNGELHQVLRDIGLMIPDMVQIIIPWLELRRLAVKNNRPMLHLISNQEFLTSAIGIFIFWILGLWV